MIKLVRQLILVPIISRRSIALDLKKSTTVEFSNKI